MEQRTKAINNNDYKSGLEQICYHAQTDNSRWTNRGRVATYELQEKSLQAGPQRDHFNAFKFKNQQDEEVHRHQTADRHADRDINVGKDINIQERQTNGYNVFKEKTFRKGG